jgi:2-keto-3-deoxy-L-rhamnonate aldolase RhmA
VITHIHKFRELLKAGHLCLGTGITFCDSAVVEALAPAVDFFWIDLEHNPIGMESLLGHLIAAKAGGAPAMVRVPSSDTWLIKRVLDSGAEGIIVPQVRSKQEVESAVAACRYSPLGNRGWGPRRPADYGRRPLSDVVREANEQLFVTVQIENMAAVEHIDEIVRVAGLDSVALGPFDLSGSMGLLGQLDHPKVVEAIQHVIRTAKDAGLYVGYGDQAIASNVVQAAALGADWIQCGSDFAYLLKCATELFDAVRSSS